MLYSSQLHKSATGAKDSSCKWLKPKHIHYTDTSTHIHKRKVVHSLYSLLVQKVKATTQRYIVLLYSIFAIKICSLTALSFSFCSSSKFVPIDTNSLILSPFDMSIHVKKA